MPSSNNQPIEISCQGPRAEKTYHQRRTYTQQTKQDNGVLTEAVKSCMDTEYYLFFPHHGTSPIAIACFVVCDRGRWLGCGTVRYRYRYWFTYAARSKQYGRTIVLSVFKAAAWATAQKCWFCDREKLDRHHVSDMRIHGT